MHEEFLKGKIYYRTNEFENGRLTFVFIHGLSGSSSAWWSYEKTFKNKYNILTYDIRGHGKSKKFPDYNDYRIENFTDDLHSLTQHLGIEKFILISHSFGTLIALEYIKVFRKSVIGVIFLSPIVYMQKGLLSKVSVSILGLSKIFNLLPRAEKKGGHVDYLKHKNSTDWDIKRCYADVKNTTLRVYLYCLRHLLLSPRNYLLEEIKIPTLVIHGTEDTMTKVENAIAMSKNIKNAELVIIKNTDHIIVLNNTKEVSEAIESFVEKSRRNMLYY